MLHEYTITVHLTSTIQTCEKVAQEFAKDFMPECSLGNVEAASICEGHQPVLDSRYYVKKEDL